MREKKDIEIGFYEMLKGYRGSCISLWKGGLTGSGGEMSFILNELLSKLLKDKK